MFRAKNDDSLSRRLGSSSSRSEVSARDRLSFSSATRKSAFDVERKDSSSDISSDEEEEERSGKRRARSWRNEKMPDSQDKRIRLSTDEARPFVPPSFVLNSITNEPTLHPPSSDDISRRQRKKLNKQKKEAVPSDDFREETQNKGAGALDFISEYISQIQDDEECLYFARGLCKRGANCNFTHKEPDIRTLLHRGSWQTFCPNFPSNCTLGSKCSNLHVTREDRVCYLEYGVISRDILEQAIKKVLLLDVPLKNDVCVCKQYLSWNCKIAQCKFLHISKLEFLWSVVAIVKAEFSNVLGPSAVPDPALEMEMKILWGFLDSNRDSQSKAVSPSPHQVESYPAPNQAESYPAPNQVESYPAPNQVESYPAFMSASELRLTNEQSPHQVESAQAFMSASELHLANELLSEEAAKYLEYCEALQRENAVIWKALNPDQPGTSITKMIDKLQLLFDVISSESKVSSLAKSLGIKRNNEAEPVHKKLYVGGLFETCREKDLLEYFSAFGTVRKIQIKLNHMGLCRGYGFVTFVDNDVAETVAASSSHLIKGNPVVVNISTSNLSSEEGDEDLPQNDSPEASTVMSRLGTTSAVMSRLGPVSTVKSRLGPMSSVRSRLGPMSDQAPAVVQSPLSGGLTSYQAPAVVQSPLSGGLTSYQAPAVGQSPLSGGLTSYQAPPVVQSPLSGGLTSYQAPPVVQSPLSGGLTSYQAPAVGQSPLSGGLASYQAPVVVQSPLSGGLTSYQAPAVVQSPLSGGLTSYQAPAVVQSPHSGGLMNNQALTMAQSPHLRVQDPHPKDQGPRDKIPSLMDMDLSAVEESPQFKERLQTMEESPRVEERLQTMEESPQFEEQLQTTINGNHSPSPEPSFEPDIPYPDTPWELVKTRRICEKMDWHSYYKVLLYTRVFGFDKMKLLKQLFRDHLREVGIDREEPIIIDSDSDSDSDDDHPQPKKTPDEAKPRRHKPKPDKEKLIVYNISNIHNEENLGEYFSKFGNLLRVIPREFFFYLKFTCIESAQAVLDHGEHHEVAGMIVSVREDLGHETFPRSKMENSIIVKSLSAQHNPDSIQEYFSKFGKLTRFATRMNCALISFADEEVKQRVLRQEEPHEVKGSRVSVQEYTKTSMKCSYTNFKQKSRMISNDPTRRLYIDTFPKDRITEDDLREFFSKYGEIEEVTIRNEMMQRPFGYIVFSDLQSAIDAEKSETEINGVALPLKYFKTFFPSRQVETENEEEQSFMETLIIRKITEDLKCEDVEEYFAQFGDFYSFDFMYKATGERRNVAFVTYRDRKVSEHVASLESLTVGDVPLNAAFIAPRYFKEPPLKAKVSAQEEEKEMECDQDEEKEKESNQDEEKEKECNQNDAELLQAKELGLMDELGNEEGGNGEEDDYNEPEEENEESKDTEESEAQPMRQKLYIGGLGQTFCDEDLLEYFSTFGEILAVEVKLNRKGRCRGFGFVTFVDNDVADKVTNSDFHEIKGTTVVVKFANPLMINRSKRFIQMADVGALQEQRNL